MSEVISYKGQLEVELEIPVGSCLSDRDIKNVLRIASWDGDVNDIVRQLDGGYEGNRSVLIPREKSYSCNGIQMAGLEISGVGYRTTGRKDIKHESGQVLSWLDIDEADPLLPPTTQNWMVVGTPDAGTSRARGRGSVAERDVYAPLGAYTAERIEVKVRNTNLVNQFGLESVCVPKIEGFGHFKNLAYEGKPLGFIVFTVPKAGKGRFSEEFFSNYKAAILQGKLNSMQLMVDNLINPIENTLCALVEGLRELHEKGYCHGQPHGSNFYDCDGRIVLMDWTTMEKFGEDREENLGRRAIDICMTQNVYERLKRWVFQGPRPSELNKYLETSTWTVLVNLLVAYTRKTHPAVLMGDKMLRGEVKDTHDFAVEWLREADQELKLVVIPAGKKVSRNASCPCGSGRKFKKCCGA